MNNLLDRKVQIKKTGVIGKIIDLNIEKKHVWIENESDIYSTHVSEIKVLD